MNVKTRNYITVGLTSALILALLFGLFISGKYVYENKEALKHRYNRYRSLNKFRGLELGSTISENKNLILLEKQSSRNTLIKTETEFFLNVYLKENENLEIGDLKADTIRYVYFDDKLMAVVIEGDSKLMGLKDVYENKYGLKFSYKDYVEGNDIIWEDYFWEDSKMKLTFTDFWSEETRITFFSKIVREAMIETDRRIKQERLNKRANDL